MKKINLVFVFFTLMLTALSCSSDDDGDVVAAVSGSLKVGDTEYELKAGIIENYGSIGDNLYNFDLSFVDTNITIVNDEPVPENNVLTLINFELFTNNPNNITEGEYFLSESINITNQTFAYVAILENIDINSDIEIEEPPFFVEGSLQVLSNGPIYEIEFTGTDNLGREINGNFSGPMTILDYSNE